MVRTLILYLTLAGTLLGCESGSYYYQAAEGHLKIMAARESIDSIVEDSSRPEKERKQLALVLTLRSFAKEALHLPVGDLYSDYVDLKRKSVVWNVVAAPEFSMTPHQWCFPIAGCVNYRGYFSESEANEYATKMQSERYDTHVGGVSAYSTLGWFEDPVLNTFLYRGDASLAALLFHEISHNLLYVKGDSAFNESFATTVEIEGLSRWLTTQSRQELLQAHLDKKQRRDEFVALILQHRKQRTALYKSDLTEENMRAKKADLIATLRKDYAQLKASWNHFAGYDRWFQGSLNNAQLSTIATYHSLVDGLQVLLANHDYDLVAFYAACERLAALDKKTRHKEILSLTR